MDFLCPGLLQVFNAVQMQVYNAVLIQVNNAVLAQVFDAHLENVFKIKALKMSPGTQSLTPLSSQIVLACPS
jgi:hypothetical protein